MSLRRSDLAFKNDDTARFLPWLIAFMVFLAALSVAGLFVLNNLSQTLGHGIRDTMTVQIPASGEILADDLSVADSLRLLRQTKGIRDASAIDRQQIAAQLEPWLGAAAASDQLPLPMVIDIEVDRASGLTAEKVVRILEPRIAGIAVDDHSHWLSSFVNALKSTELAASAIVILIGLATMATIIFTTRTGMDLHRQTIEVMHFVGAKDSYIARQFAIRAFKLGLGGGLIGVICAVPTLLIMAFLVGNLESGLVPDLHLSKFGWISIAMLVPATALLALATARRTVTKSLSKLV